MRTLGRRLVKALGAVLLLLIVLAAGVWVASNRALHGAEVGGHPVDVPDGAEAVAAGERLVRSSLCSDCHGEDLGGQVFIDEPPFMVLPAPNLTTGEGGVAGADAAILERAIRHGIGRDGRQLVIMPSHFYNELTDDEIGKIIAYLRAAPPVDRESGRRHVGPAGRIAVLTSGDELLPSRTVPYDAPHERAVEPGSRAQGRQLSLSCRACHGRELAGGHVAGTDTLRAPNLTPDPEGKLAGWTVEDFRHLLRSGRRPDGSAVASYMPWQAYSGLTDLEIEALWSYVSTVEARPTAMPGG
ncbi:MAG: c-type cytochrome [Gemmatimonadota bacterium]|jgi:mono/diheme cytochrome c family protein